MIDKWVRSVGNIQCVSELIDGPGVRVANDFMKRLVEEFAKQASLYIGLTSEVPFAYRERQLHSILAPALSKVADSFLMEMPVERNWSSMLGSDSRDSHGWVDYWCSYRDVAFLIELKYGFISMSTGRVRKRDNESWQKALLQLDVIKKEARFQRESYNNAFRVAIDILPIYANPGTEFEKGKGALKDIVSYHQKCVSQFSPSPNWSAFWTLHNDLVLPCGFEKSTEIYPGVLFVSRVLK